MFYLIKITKRIPIGSHSKPCNTDLSFPPDQDICIFSTPIKAGEVDSEKESDDPSFILESTAGSVSVSASSCDSVTENDFFKADIMKKDDFNNVNEPRFIVFWSCFLFLFSSCFTCFSKNFIDKVSVRGTLLLVKMICKNKHMFEWKSQPKLKSISIGNILLSSSVLYSGNAFGQIYEMFKMINIACISKARFFEIQKTLLFPVVNRF